MAGYLAPFPKSAVISQRFGSNPGGYNPPGGHTGTDYAVPVGTPVRAAGNGIIRHSDWFTARYNENPWWLTNMGGDTLVLDCTDAFGRSDTMPTFVYAHLSKSTAVVGQRVKRGQIIGLSGNSGTATSGPHCHVEALPPKWDVGNGTFGRVDPARYFTDYYTEPVTPKGSTTVATSPTLTQITAAVKSAVWPFSGARPGGKPITMWNRIVSTHEVAVKTAADVAAIRALLEKDETRA